MIQPFPMTASLADWRDPTATLLPETAGRVHSITGAPTLCPYCKSGHGQPVVTGVHSPRYGRWETCRSCAMIQLAYLHGIHPCGSDEMYSVVKAGSEAIHREDHRRLGQCNR